MKCYMSTDAGHAYDGSRYVCGLNELSAVAEARRILAETEPIAKFDDWATRHKSLSDIAALGNGSALAESLRSFVEGN